MACHNAYPDIPAGHDQLRSEPLFTGAMPEGIDCQRCHGSGRRHIQMAMTSGAAVDAIRSSIVNPARLSPERQIEVCIQCHLETTSFPFPHSIAKYDRGPFSYQPGEPLGDFMLFFDHAPAGPNEDRFQIVNSAYRLRMSACFLKSNGAMRCTTCHDPHQQAKPAYNTLCRQCHASRPHTTAATNCVECHMPKRRTADVVHAVMTDHYIQRRKPDRDLLADIAERNGPETVYRGEVLPYYPRPLERTAENDLYLALAQVRENNNPDRGIAQFSAAIEKHRPTQAEFYVELADAWNRAGKSSNAIALYEEALRRKPDLLAAWLGLGTLPALLRATQLAPDDARSWQQLGELYVKQGKKAEAAVALRKSLALDPEVPETHYALGILLSDAASFIEAVRLQPDYAAAHMNLAILLYQRESVKDSVYHFEYALRVRPDYALGHLNYGRMLASVQNTEEAARHLRLAAASSDAAVRVPAMKLLSELGK